MNWIIQTELDQVMANVRASGLLQSLCTIMRPSGVQGDSGAPDGQYVAVAGLVDIACRMAPMSIGTPSADEHRLPEETQSEEPKHVLLNAAYPAVREVWLNGGVAVIDNIRYTIMGVEGDGSSEMTRMYVRIAGI